MELARNIKVSIIIPHYNIPNLVIRLLNSIPDVIDYQVIVIDDNSSCDISALIDYCANRNNVELYFSEQNKGAGHARNVGLKYAIGKWLIFADADDFFTYNFSKIVDSQYNSDSDIICFKVASVYSEDINKPAQREVHREKWFNLFNLSKDENILRYHTVEMWGKMIKKTLVDEYNIFFDETPVANDYFFSIKCGYYAKKVSFVDEIFYVITERIGSVSSNGWASSRDKLLIRINVATRVQIFLNEHGVILKPMPIRGMMVLLLKNWPLTFILEISKLFFQRKISVLQLLYQIIIYR